MIRLTGLAATAVVVALAAGPIFAQGPGGGAARGRGAGGPGSMGIPLASLSLTQAQRDVITDIRQRSRGEMDQLAQRLRSAEEAQRTAVRTVPLNEGLVRSAALALAEVQSDIAVHEARTYNEIFAALTAEQQSQVRQRQAEQLQRRRDSRRSQTQ